MGGIRPIGFPEEIDHLHLGGSCKGRFIKVEKVKEIQKRTNCSVSIFYGDPSFRGFRFHHRLLDAVSNIKVYSASLYGTKMWRDEVNWVLHPTDEKVYKLVKHKRNDTVLFVGHISRHRKKVIKELNRRGIEVDVVGYNGNIRPSFGRDLSDVSKNYTISIGIPYDPSFPKIKYCSSRLPNALAMGLIYIESDFKLSEVFNDNEIIQWHSIADLVTKIEYYQRNPAQGLEIIMRGRKKVLENWTFDSLAYKFLKEGGMNV